MTYRGARCILPIRGNDTFWTGRTNTYYYKYYYIYLISITGIFFLTRWLFYLRLQRCPVLSWSNVEGFTFCGQQREARVPDATRLPWASSENRRGPRTRPWGTPPQKRQTQSCCPWRSCSRTFRQPLPLMETCTPECLTMALILAAGAVSMKLWDLPVWLLGRVCVSVGWSHEVVQQHSPVHLWWLDLEFAWEIWQFQRAGSFDSAH